MPSTSESAHVPLNRSALAANIKIIGLGRAGVKILGEFVKLPETAWIEPAVVDTDSASVSSSPVKHRFLVGEEWTGGFGCGGNPDKGETALSHKSNVPVKEFIEGASLLFVIGGFGGGTATGGSSVIGRIAREKGIPCVFLMTIPFSFEGHAKREIAESKIEALVKSADLLIPVPNDLLYSSLPASAPSETAFEKANEEVARAALGLAEVLRCDNLLPIDFSDFQNLLSKRKSECAIGVGVGETGTDGDRCHAALERLVASPLLGGKKTLSEAHAVMLTITGGPGLPIGEMRQSLDAIVRLASKKARVAVGANTDAAYGNRVQITAVAIKYDLAAEPLEEPQAAPLLHKGKRGHHRGGKESGAFVQPDLPFQRESRGAFSNTTPTNHKGEDLDIPPFQRRGIHLDKGK